MTPRDFATEIDRTWFAEHPDAECYLRPMVRGEWGLIDTEGAKYVLVTNLCPGGRVKQPMKIFTEHGGIPAELMWVDTGERWLIRQSGEIVPKHPTRRKAWEALLTPDSVKLVQVGRTLQNTGGRS